MKIGSDKLFVTCLIDNSDKKAKSIKNYLDLCINTSLNHMSIRSRLVSQLNQNLKLNSEQLLKFYGLITYYLWCHFTSETTR